MLKEFLSTPSGWRATRYTRDIRDAETISIHALRVEGDFEKSTDFALFINISIHALRVEGDGTIAVTLSDGNGISIHALRVEGDGII